MIEISEKFDISKKTIFTLIIVAAGFCLFFLMIFVAQNRKTNNMLETLNESVKQQKNCIVLPVEIITKEQEKKELVKEVKTDKKNVKKVVLENDKKS